MSVSPLNWNNAEYRLNDNLQVVIGDLNIKKNDLIVLIGGNGSGKTSVARALNNELKLACGSAPEKYFPALVSFEEQIKLFEEDFAMRNTDAATPEEELGITPAKLLEGAYDLYKEQLIDGLNLRPLMNTPIRMLSGGEGRKVLIAKALSSRPSLIIFDTPFDALDVATRASLKELINEIHIKYDTPTVLIVNRAEEIPETLTKMGIIENCSIKKLSTREEIEADPDARTLLGTISLPDPQLPDPPKKLALKPIDGDTIVALKKVSIVYSRPIFKDLDFTIRKGEHWQIVGPNGAGKSTLLSLITGENPLVYTNDVTVFGYKRGSGESIWDIKKYYGLVSGALHIDYRVSAPVINVVLSGFYDSIGLYQQPGDEELSLARKWLTLAGLADKEQISFKALSYGQQRLLLILRALVKKPPLLILDEPLHGLDGYARALVKSFISNIMKQGTTSVLFVSHHESDMPSGFTNRLAFVEDKSAEGGYRIEQESLK